MPSYTWTAFTAYLDGTRVIRFEERDELWTALAYLLDQCGGRWTLIEADIDAIKASQFLSDLTHVEDDDGTVKGNLAKVLIDIQDTFTGTTGYDAFKAVRADEGLDSDEKLAEIISETGRVGGGDDYHLWNLYKRVLTFLQCCPTGEMPDFVYDSIERSFSKCGYPGLTPAGADRRFKRRRVYGHEYITDHCNSSSGGGSETVIRDLLLTVVRDYEFIYTYAREDGARGCGMLRTLQENESFLERRDRVETGDMGWSYTCFFQRLKEPLLTSTEVQTGDPYCWAGLGCDYSDCDPDVFVPFESPELVTYSTTNECDKSGTGGWITRTHSKDILEGYQHLDEYTDEQLEEEIDEAIDEEGFDDDRNDAAGSRFVWSADHLDLEKRISKGFLPLATVSLSNGKSYDLIYFVRYTPDGGAAEDGDEVTFSFTYTTGMTHAGPIDVPVVEGGDCTLHLVRWECPEDEE